MRPLLCLLLAACTAAHAHDTWFEPRGGTLALGTGNQFPLIETGIAAQHVARSGCRGGPLAVAQETDSALLFTPPPGARSCWLQLDAFELTLDPALIDTYLREVNPPPDVRAAAQALQREGRPWHERYVKHARIAFEPDPEPAGLGLELVLESTAPPTFRAFRDGQPLPGFAVELRHERARIGAWRRTDAEGRVALPLPLPGRWLLRGIDLRPAPDGRWDSRFATLAFDVQNGMNLRSNARSANQAAATAAMASEPASSTPRR